MTEPRDSPFLRVTWLKRIMAGERRCVWEIWFRAHFQNYDEQPKDLSRWNIEHRQMLDQLYSERINAGEQVFLEKQNDLRILVNNEVMLVGTPDLVTVSESGTVIYDVKTGKERLSDKYQVLLYMYLLPLTTRYSGCKPSGCVVYKHKRVPLPANLLDQSFIQRFEHFFSVVTVETPAIRVSGDDCRFCDLTKSDCHERVEHRHG